MKSFYVHGRASNTGHGDGPTHVSTLPYLLFGRNSTRQTLDGVQKALSTPNGDLKSTLIGAHEANFMVCHWIKKTCCSQVLIVVFCALDWNCKFCNDLLIYHLCNVCFM